jgi:hypothetical protein
MGDFKRTVKNKAKVEGSICKAGVLTARDNIFLFPLFEIGLLVY